MTNPKASARVERDLRAVDEALLRRGASADSVARVRERLRERATNQPLRARLRWWPMVAFVAGALLALSVLVPRLHEGPPSSGGVARDVGPRRAALPSVPSPVVSDSDEACPRVDSPEVELSRGDCVLLDGVRITASADASFTHESTPATNAEAYLRMEWVRGEALLDVPPRSDRPLLIGLGDREVEVIGTRFVLRREGASGWLTMLEGEVEVREAAGSVRRLRGGQRMVWPGDDAAPRPRKRRRAPRSADPEPSAASESLADLLRDVASLRRAGRHDEALDRLRAFDTSKLDLRSRRVVSHEIGSLLEREGGSREQACAHWAAHAKRFSEARDAERVRASMKRLGCSDPTP